MIQYRLQSTAPHLRVDLADTVSREEVTRDLAPLPDDLTGVPEGFVALIVYPDLHLIEEDAVGALYNAVTYLLHARPSRCVFVNGGWSPHPGLRKYIERLARDGQVVFVKTEADAAAYIGQGNPSRPSAPGPSS